jgi:hypothetical protein
VVVLLKMGAGTAEAAAAEWAVGLTGDADFWW